MDNNKDLEKKKKANKKKVKKVKKVKKKKATKKKVDKDKKESIKKGVKPQKYYAIKEAKGVKDKIVRTWAECEKLVSGCPAVYKSFLTEYEALEYLKTVNTELVREQAKWGIGETRRKRATTRVLSVRLDKDLFLSFEEKCNKLGLTKEDFIKNMVKKWINLK